MTFSSLILVTVQRPLNYQLFTGLEEEATSYLEEVSYLDDSGDEEEENVSYGDPGNNGGPVDSTG